MTIESQADFARRMERHMGRAVARSTVKRWADAGRIVLADGRLVDVEASLAQLEGTQGGRTDVADRHAQDAKKKSSSDPSNRAGGESEADMGMSSARRSRALADARIQQATAEMREMDRDEQAKRLIRVEDVNFSLDHFGATLRSLMETFADRLAPLIWPLQTLEETHAALSEAAEGVLMEMREAMQRAAGEHGGGA